MKYKIKDMRGNVRRKFYKIFLIFKNVVMEDKLIKDELGFS